MALTTLSSMSVRMNREAAWTVKPFPTAATDMFPCFIAVTALRVHRTGRFRRRRSVPGTRVPSKTHGKNGCRRKMLLRVNEGVHSVENELWGNGT